jgi:hypothetical protein
MGRMRGVHRGRRGEAPALITSARRSAEDEYEHRRRKYALMMFIRGVAVIAAALCYQVSVWISLACLAAGAVLPWCAVLIANDNPPKNRRRYLGPAFGPADRALPGAGPERDRTIEG